GKTPRVVRTEAKELSLRANPEEAEREDARSFMPTASGRLARAAYARAAATSIDLDALLRQTALTSSKMLNPHVRLPVKTQIAFVNRVAQALGSPFLGFELAQEVELRELGMLYDVLASTDTLGLALARAARFSTIVNEGVRIVYRQGR